MSNAKASEVLASTALFADYKQREILMRFFKTGPGQYERRRQVLRNKSARDTPNCERGTRKNRLH